MDFEQYINIEEKTIKEFIQSSPDLSLNKIYNTTYSRIDFTFFSAGTYNQGYTPIIDGICEVKTRKYSSEEYNDGALIELEKLTAIIVAVAKEKNNPDNINKTIKGYYLMKYSDKTFLFDLLTIDLGNIEIKKLPKKTAGYGRIEYVYKPIVIIPYEKAVLIY